MMKIPILLVCFAAVSVNGGGRAIRMEGNSHIGCIDGLEKICDERIGGEFIRHDHSLDNIPRCTPKVELPEVETEVPEIPQVMSPKIKRSTVECELPEIPRYTTEAEDDILILKHEKCVVETKDGNCLKGMELHKYLFRDGKPNLGDKTIYGVYSIRGWSPNPSIPEVGDCFAKDMTFPDNSVVIARGCVIRGVGLTVKGHDTLVIGGFPERVEGNNIFWTPAEEYRIDEDEEIDDSEEDEEMEKSDE